VILSTKRLVVFALLLVLILPAQQAWSENLIHRFAANESNSIAPFLVLGELSLARDGAVAKPEMVQGFKALVTTGLLTEMLKYGIRERRPNSTSFDSFPSGHTSTAFAMATVLADYHPHYAVAAYAMATGIAWSRLEVGAHHIQDVFAGAALGYFTAKHFTNKHIEISATGAAYNWKW